MKAPLFPLAVQTEEQAQDIHDWLGLAIAEAEKAVEPAKALALAEDFVAKAGGREESLRSQGSAALRLVFLYAMRQVLRGELQLTPESTVWFTLLYADLRLICAGLHHYRLVTRMDRLITSMLPDYILGTKVRKGGAKRPDTWQERYRDKAEKAKRLRAIERQLPPQKSKIATYKAVARIYSRETEKSVSYKTVERLIRGYIVPLELLELAIRNERKQ